MKSIGTIESNVPMFQRWFADRFFFFGPDSNGGNAGSVNGVDGLNEPLLALPVERIAENYTAQPVIPKISGAAPGEWPK